MRTDRTERIFLNTFESVIDRKVDSTEDIQKFEKTFQYARNNIDYAIGESIYMLPSDMNLQIGKIKSYNNKILISLPSFKIGINLKINHDDDKPDVKSRKEEIIKTKPDTKSKNKDERDIKLIKT